MAQIGSSTKNREYGRKLYISIFALLFGVLKRKNLFETPQRSVKIKIMSFFISIKIILGCLAQKGLIKIFLLGFS